MLSACCLRAGRHIDHEWVYAHQPLVRPSTRQADWDWGILMPSAQLLTRRDEHRLFFEARPCHHEHRYSPACANKSTIGTAHWDRDRIVALRAAHADRPGYLITKAFLPASGGHVRLTLNTSSCGSSIAVELLSAHDGSSVPGRSLDEAIPTAGVSGVATARWASGTRLILPGSGSADQAKIQLRFRLTGGAQLFAFRLRLSPESRARTRTSEPAQLQVK